MIASVVFPITGLFGCGGGGDTGSPIPLWVPTDVVVADVNGDGRNDVVTLAMFRPAGYGTDEGHFFVYLQTGTPGVFEAPVDYSVGLYPWHGALADVDGDGRPDLVLADPGADTVWLVLQDGTRPGRFLAPEPLITGVNAYTAVIADLNDDGAPDVATDEGLCSSKQILIRYQDPVMRGSFGPQTSLALPHIPTELAAGDLDGDGLDDLLVTVKDGCPPSFVLWNAGYVVAYQKPGGGFDLSGPLAMQPSACNVRRLAIADLNADGRQDFFAFETPAFPACSSRLAAVLQTSIPRSFAAPVFTSLASILGDDDAALSDLNQDTLPDVALAGFWPESGGALRSPDRQIARQSNDEWRGGDVCALGLCGNGFRREPPRCRRSQRRRRQRPRVARRRSTARGGDVPVLARRVPAPARPALTAAIPEVPARSLSRAWQLVRPLLDW